MTRTELHLRRWIARSLLTVLLLAGLAGCGASLVYPRLDSLVGLYLRGLVSLDGSQSASLARTLEHNLEWHRSEELERYDAFLQGLASQVRAGVTRAGLEDAAQQAEVYWRRIFEQAAPGYTALAATLSDRQVHELLESLQRADEKTWREYSRRTPEDRRARREKSLRKNIERMTGPLSPQQRQLVRDYAWTARPFMFEWRENRRLWREELAATLRVRSGPRAAFDERMRVLIARTGPPVDARVPQGDRNQPLGLPRSPGAARRLADAATTRRHRSSGCSPWRKRSAISRSSAAECRIARMQRTPYAGKIFAIGFYKTGTTTLFEALKVPRVSHDQRRQARQLPGRRRRRDAAAADRARRLSAADVRTLRCVHRQPLLPPVARDLCAVSGREVHPDGARRRALDRELRELLPQSPDPADARLDVRQAREPGRQCREPAGVARRVPCAQRRRARTFSQSTRASSSNSTRRGCASGARCASSSASLCPPSRGRTPT